VPNDFQTFFIDGLYLYFLNQCVTTETWLNVFSYLLFVLGIVSMLVEYLVAGSGAKGKSP
jgi:hypothetical protein